MTTRPSISSKAESDPTEGSASSKSIIKHAEMSSSDHMDDNSVRLPQEILHRIFLACVDKEWSIEQLHNLAQVCQSWSDAVFSCCHLWTTLSAHQTPELNSAIIRHSKAAMLTVKCEHCDEYATAPPRLMEMAIAHAPRVQRFTCSGLDPEEVLAPWQTGFPNLLALSLRVHTRLFGNPPLYTFSLFEGLPLEHLELESVRVVWESPRLSCLTILKIKGGLTAFPRFSQLHSMLSMCHNLIVVELDVTGVNFLSEQRTEQDMANTPKAPILLASLQHLAFNLPAHQSHHLATFLSAPALMYLRAQPLGLVHVSSFTHLPTLLRKVLRAGKSYRLEYRPMLKTYRFVAFTSVGSSTSNELFNEEPSTACCDIEISGWGLPQSPWEGLLHIARACGYAAMPGHILIDQSHLYDQELALPAQDALPGVITLSCTDTYNILPLLQYLSKTSDSGFPWPNLRGLHIHYNYRDDSRIRTAVESFAESRCGPNDSKRWKSDSDGISLCLLGHQKEGCCVVVRLS